MKSAPGLDAKEDQPMRPSQSEDLHVRQHEPNFCMQQLREAEREATEMEKYFLKRLHWMRCPKCGTELASERQGTFEIDVCQGCQGVWLDARELEAVVAPVNDFLRSALRSLRHRQ